MSRNFVKNWLSQVFARRPATLQSPRKRLARRAPPRFEVLEDRINLAPIPMVTLGGAPNTAVFPTDVLMGEVVRLSVTFENTGDATGFGPYVELFLPATGIDGRPGECRDYVNNHTFLDPDAYVDGITFVSGSATYLSTSVSEVGTPITFPGGSVTSPLSGYPINPNTSSPLNPITFYPGDQLVVLKLPIGSYAPGEPALTVYFDVMVSNFADRDQPLPIYATGGFQYGTSATGSTAISPFAPSGAPGSNVATATMTPRLMILTKEYLGPEDETATGPSFLQKYQIIVNVADDQTVTNLTITDTLPPNLQFHALVSATGDKDSSSNPSILTSNPLPTTPTATLDKVLGKLGHMHNSSSPEGDAQMTFSFYVPFLDPSNVNVLDPTTGDDKTALDDAKVTGEWIPEDLCDGDGITPVPVDSDLTPVDHELTIKSIAVQKTVFDVTTNSTVSDHHYVVDSSAPASSVPRPGDILRYTLTFQVSDFFAFKDVVIKDQLSDGQRFINNFNDDPSTVPTFTFTRGGTNNPGSSPPNGIQDVFTSPISPPNIVPSGPTYIPSATTGITTVRFNLSDELISRGFNADGKMIGAGVADNGSYQTVVVGGISTTGTLIFYVQVLENYTGTADQPPNKDMSVDHGDVLINGARISGEVLQIDDGLPANAPHQFEDDDTYTKMVLPNGELTKSIYAVTRNGVTNFGLGLTSVAAGDLVTFRLQYFLPFTDSDHLKITDFLPDPVFAVSNAPLTYVPPSSPFLANQYQWGPLDTLSSPIGAPFFGFQPTAMPFQTNNSITFDFNYQPFTLGSFDDPSSMPRLIDILFTVKVSAAPFADGLFLTNLVHSEERTTNNGTANGFDIVAQNAIVGLTLGEPVLNIRKGVVATDNPNGVFSTQVAPVGSPVGRIAVTAPGQPGWRFKDANNTANLAVINSTNINSPLLINQPDLGNGANYTPYTLDSNLNNVDAADYVTFAIVIGNTGSGPNGAFNVSIKDTVPAGFTVPATGLNLFVADGSGAPFGTGMLAGGTFTFTSQTPIFTIDLFNPGPTPTPPGAIDPSHATSGRNFVVITYDLRVNKNPTNPLLPPAVRPLDVLANTATLTNYTSTPNNGPGLNFVPNGLSDSATVTIAALKLVKTLVQTEIVGNGVSWAVIGERAKYTLKLKVPEGITPSAQIVDTLGAGLAYVTTPAPTVNWGGLTHSPAFSVTLSPIGTPTVTFNLGTLTNNNTVNTMPEYVTITFWTQVLNVVGNQDGTQLTNMAAPAWTGHTNEPNVSAPPLLVIEPKLVVKKTANPMNLDAGGIATFTITVENLASNGSKADAFDVRLADLIPAGLAFGNGSLVNTPTFWPGTLNQAAGIVSASWLKIPLGKTAKFTFKVKLSPKVAPCTDLTNFAPVTWTSLPNNPGQRLTYNQDSRERNGAFMPFELVQGNSTTNEQQLIVIPNSVTNFTFYYGINGFPMTFPAGGMPLTTIKPNLQWLLGAANVTVTGPNGGPFIVTFTGTQGNQNVNMLTGGINDYVHTGSAVVHVNGSDICGFVYCDENDNGKFDPSEHGIAGVTLLLTGLDHLGNPVNMTVITDANGEYCFECLRPSSGKGYTITEIQPAGHLDGDHQAGTPFGGNVTVPNIISQIVIPLGSNTMVTGYNFGELGYPSISGTVYLDLDHDGVQDPGEANIPGVTITLTGPSGPYTTTTAGDGSYSFTGLQPGTYTITETQPALYADGMESVGTAGGTTGGVGGPNDTISGIVVSWCDEATGYNFGEDCLPPPPPPIPDCPDPLPIPLGFECPVPPQTALQLPPPNAFALKVGVDLLVYSQQFGNATVIITEGTLAGTLNVNINGFNLGDKPNPTATLYIDTTYSGNDTIIVNLSQNHSMNIDIHTGAGNDTVTINGSSPLVLPSELTGFLCIDTDMGDDTVTIENITIANSVSIEGGPGNDVASIGINLPVLFQGDTYTEGVNTFTVGSHATVNGSLIMHNENDPYSPNTVTLSAGSHLGSNVFYNGGPVTVVDVITLAGTISGTVVFNMGSGDNSLTVLGSSFVGGSFFWDSGSGDDTVTILGHPTFAGDVDLHLGDGNNAYNLGPATDFQVTGDMCIEGGSGTDTFFGGFTGLVQGDLIVKLGSGLNQFGLGTGRLRHDGQSGIIGQSRP